MDFIERLFGISPDGGSGALELMLLAVPLLILASLASYKRWRRSAASPWRRPL
jgi:hypothetical protein